MKYYSEKLRTMFDTEDALKQAEKAHCKEQCKREEEQAQLKGKIEKAKQEVDTLEKACDEAHKKWVEAKRELDDLLQRYRFKYESPRFRVDNGNGFDDIVDWLSNLWKV